MPAIRCNGVQLTYEDQGAGAPAFLLVHGWTCNRSFFAPQAEHFAGRHRVVSVDLRGHGESEKPDGEYSIAVFAEDLADLIRRLDLGRVIAVGHSMGGLIVLQLAVAHPDLVAAVAMLDPAPFSADVRAAMEAIASATEGGNQEPRRQLIAKTMFLATSDPKLVERVLAVAMSAPNDVAAKAFRAMIAFDGAEAAARCKVPALHIAGTPPLNPPHLMKKWLPGVVQGWTVGAGHFNQLEAPDQVNSMIDGFLRHYVSGR
jgi:pimeloyl-ACP methyl ester carboxylesterase